MNHTQVFRKIYIQYVLYCVKEMKPEPETQPCSKSESTDGSDSNFRPSLEEILTEKKMVGC